MTEQISVVIPCYNVSSYIEETYASVLNQTFLPAEVILVNDGSTDNTLEIISKLAKSNNITRIISTTNGGVSKARNVGISLSSNEMIFLMDGDDTINPEYFEKLLQEFKKDTNTTLAIGAAQFFGRVNHFWDISKFDMETMLQRNLIYCGCMIKKSLWDKAGRFDEQLKVREDWDFFIRYTSLNPEGIKQISYLGFNYRLREDGRDTQLENHALLQETNFYIYTKNKELYFKYYDDPISLLKKIEKTKWENEKKERQINFLRKFFFNRTLLKIREKRNGS